MKEPQQEVGALRWGPKTQRALGMAENSLPTCRMTRRLVFMLNKETLSLTNPRTLHLGGFLMEQPSWLLTFQRKELSKRLAREAEEISNNGAVSREEGSSAAPTSGRGARPQGLLCAFQPRVNLHTSPYPIPPV